MSSIQQPLVLTPSEVQAAKSAVVAQNLEKSELKNLSSVNKERAEKKKSKHAKINNNGTVRKEPRAREGEYPGTTVVV